MRIRSGMLTAGCGLLALALFGGIGEISGQSLSTGQPALEKFSTVSGLVMDKCMACHSRNFDLPFYAKIPGIKQIIEQDYNDGLRAMDLSLELVETAGDRPVGEGTLAKMEWVMLNETMPPAKFTAVHWGSRMSTSERSTVLDWVRESRANHYATGLAAPARANEPLQPLPDSIPVDGRKAELGRQLFNDKRLSGDGTVACVTCHAYEKAGTDNRRFALGIREQSGDINAPTVFNAVFNVKQFWNGRAASLQEQAGGPPFNPIEMGSKDWDEICGRLATDAKFSAVFRQVYPAGWTGDNIMDAIAEYEKTLITPNSRFDKWLKGDDAALSKKEIEGYELFKRYRCSSCHVGRSVGGQSFEYMDLKQDYFGRRQGGALGSDEGLRAFTGNPDDLHRFKVPNLRNIELTAPYLHDGTLATLDDAVQVMGTYLSGLEVPPGDRKDIVSFLRTLTGEFEGKPLAGIPVSD